MLVISRVRRQVIDDDSGAVLVTVVVVMLVGFVIAAVIAASVMFTIQANAENKTRTQAFVAAESGRDVARAAIVDATDAVTGFNCTGLTLAQNDVSYGTKGAKYSYAIYPTTNSGSCQPCPWHDALMPDGCHNVRDHSCGGGRRSSHETIDSVYRWVKQIDDTTGGTLAYFGGTVAGQKSVYDGDLVVRAGAYTCPLDAVITGDLWVTNGTVTLSQGCHIMGSVYSYGAISTGSKDVKIDGDVLSNFDITLSNNGHRHRRSDPLWWRCQFDRQRRDERHRRRPGKGQGHGHRQQRLDGAGSSASAERR